MKRISALNFAMELILYFKLSTKLSDIYHGQMDIIEQETTNLLRISVK